MQREDCTRKGPSWLGDLNSVRTRCEVMLLTTIVPPTICSFAPGLFLSVNLNILHTEVVLAI